MLKGVPTQTGCFGDDNDDVLNLCKDSVLVKLVVCSRLYIRSETSDVSSVQSIINFPNNSVLFWESSSVVLAYRIYFEEANILLLSLKFPINHLTSLFCHIMARRYILCKGCCGFLNYYYYLCAE